MSKLRFFLLFFAVVIAAAFVSAQENKIILHPDQAKFIINKNIYSHFAEHLGRGIYGGIWVGENSPVPNTRGIRNDVVNALKAIDIPALRWPGGCFADEYHWKNGIGPKELRPTMINTNWGGITEDNSFGTHEFLDLCQQLGCEPIICGNLGSGTVEEMSQWVEYLNSDNISPMTDLRKKNGRNESWGVKYWGLGNEAWGCGGSMTPEFYFDQMMRYSNFCRDYGADKLYRIACGPSADDYNWTEVMMKKWSQKSAWDRGKMNAISLHYYTICHDWSHKGSATDFDESEWFGTIKQTLVIQEYINKHIAIMDKYDPEKKIGLVVDEWGNWFDVEPGTNPGFLYQQNTLRDAMVAGINLNIFNQHADRVTMANIAQMVNVLQSVILTQEDKIVLTPTYYVFKMYKEHMDAVLVPMELTSKNYSFNGSAIPALSASASEKKDGSITLTIVNIDPNKTMDLLIDAGIKIKTADVVVLTSDGMNDYNDFEKDVKLKPLQYTDYKINTNEVQLVVPKKSIVRMTLFR